MQEAERNPFHGFIIQIWTGNKEKSFTVRVVKHWDKLSMVLVDALSLETIKVRVDGALST